VHSDEPERERLHWPIAISHLGLVRRTSMASDHLVRKGWGREPGGGSESLWNGARGMHSPDGAIPGHRDCPHDAIPNSPLMRFAGRPLTSYLFAVNRIPAPRQARRRVLKKAPLLGRRAPQGVSFGQCAPRTPLSIALVAHLRAALVSLPNVRGRFNG